MSGTQIGITTRFGGDEDSPSEATMRAALREVYHEDHPDLLEGDYLEHPNAWMTYSVQNGAVTQVSVLDVYRTGLVIYSMYADEEFLNPEFQLQRRDVDEAEALKLWLLLANGATEELGHGAWEPYKQAE
jgi:hypothetical protein